MLITWTFPSFFSVLPCSVLYFFLFLLFSFLLSFPFSCFLPSLPFKISFFPAIYFVSLFLSPSVAVTSQRSEDVIPTLQPFNFWFISLFLYCSVRQPLAPQRHSPAPFTLHTQPLFFTNSPRRPEPQPWRRADAPRSCRSWSPQTPAMPSRLAFLNVTVAPAGDISDQPLQPAVPS